MPCLIPSMAGVHLSGVMLGILPLVVDAGAVVGKEGQLTMSTDGAATALYHGHMSFCHFA